MHWLKKNRESREEMTPGEKIMAKLLDEAKVREKEANRSANREWMRTNIPEIIDCVAFFPGLFFLYMGAWTTIGPYGSLVALLILWRFVYRAYAKRND